MDAVIGYFTGKLAMYDPYNDLNRNGLISIFWHKIFYIDEHLK